MPSQLAQHSCLLLQLFTSLMGLLGPKTDSKVNEWMNSRCSTQSAMTAEPHWPCRNTASTSLSTITASGPDSCEPRGTFESAILFPGLQAVQGCPLPLRPTPTLPGLDISLSPALTHHFRVRSGAQQTQRTPLQEQMRSDADLPYRAACIYGSFHAGAIPARPPLPGRTASVPKAQAAAPVQFTPVIPGAHFIPGHAVTPGGQTALAPPRPPPIPGTLRPVPDLMVDMGAWTQCHGVNFSMSMTKQLVSKDGSPLGSLLQQDSEMLLGGAAFSRNRHGRMQHICPHNTTLAMPHSPACTLPLTGWITCLSRLIGWLVGADQQAQQRAAAAAQPPALPSQAAQGQPIRLPGQARVDPAEYREFLMLGHGGVYELDVDR